MKIVCALFALLLTSTAMGADFYVSPAGSDVGPGTQAEPFASLQRARDAVREARRTGTRRDYTVLLRGGAYRLKETVLFTRGDSAADGFSVTYQAFPGETPVFTSGVEIQGWRREGKLWVADLPAGMKPFLTLYDGQGRLPRARGTPFSPTADYTATPKMDFYTLPFPPGALKNWPNLRDVEVMIRPNYAWVLDMLPLESVDEQAGLARTQIPASYHMVKVRWGPRDVNTKGTVWVENALEVLDEPGEWVLDTQARKVYLWPRGERPERIEAPQLTELIRVEGDIDYDGPVDKPVRGLVFRGLSFTRGDRLGWEKERRGSTLQHDWEMFDRPTSLVRLRGAEDVTIDRCHFFESGGGAVRLDLHARDNRITGSAMEHLGGSGVLIAGYGPGTKDVSRRNRIERNHLHHLGEILWHSPAIYLWQSGENHVANNLIHDLNYSGILVSGRISWLKDGRGDGWATIRWKEIEALGKPELLPSAPKRPDWYQREPFLHGRNNIVERNEIYGVVKKLWDGDAIYISGTGGGNRVRENFIHDCMSENMGEAIRCDDDQHQTWIERNIVYRTGGMGTGIAIKGTNHVLNNFIVDSTGAFQPRGLISIESAPVAGSMIQRNILVAGPLSPKPFFLKNLLGPPEPRFSETKTNFNLFWHTADAKWAEAHLTAARSQGMEGDGLFADPLFIDPASGDCRFRVGSPAPGLGIEPIDLRKAGLR